MLIGSGLDDTVVSIEEAVGSLGGKRIGFGFVFFRLAGAQGLAALTCEEPRFI